MKTLAVDDDQIVLGILKGVLERAGLGEVETCESATEALAAIDSAEKPFTCFLLDIQMPGMDGIELCERIRQHPQARTASILMLTAMSDQANIECAFAAGANDYITKPLDATQVIVRLGIAEQSATISATDLTNRQTVHGFRY